MGLKTKIIFNTVIQIFGRLFTAATTYLVALLLVRSYGVFGFGEFVKITTFVSYFYIISDFGANAIVVKKMTDEKNSEEKFLGNLLSMRILGSIALMFIAISLLLFLPQGNSQGFTKTARFGILLCSFTIISQSLITTANAYFQKTMRYDKSIVAVVCGYLLTISLAYIFSFARVSISVVSLAYVFGGFFTAAISFLLIRQKILPLFDIGIWKNIFISSLPLGLMLTLNVVYFKADSFILTLTRPTQEVGIYGLAYKFFEMSLTLPTFFMNSLYPVFLEKRQNEGRGFLKILKKSGLILLLASLVATLVFIVFAPTLINFTSGDKQVDFAGAISALRILSLSLPFFFVSSFLMWFLIANNKQKILPALYAVSMVFNVVLNLVFIPTHGYLAAATITVVSEAVVMLLLIIPCWKYQTYDN
jgi:O-antigen/teichoic acid export membrane protein